MGDGTNIARLLLQTNAVLVRPREPFSSASGTPLPTYCDNRVLLSYPQEREEIIDAMVEITQHLHFDVVAGTATAGIPWAAWLAQRTGKPMVYVRSQAKAHGKGKQIEGELRQGQKALVVEDLITTGGSALGAIDALRQAGATVTDCISLFTYELAVAREGFLHAHCKLHALTTLSDLLAHGTVSGDITADDANLVREWQRERA